MALPEWHNLCARGEPWSNSHVLWSPCSRRHAAEAKNLTRSSRCCSPKDQVQAALDRHPGRRKPRARPGIEK
jgi:hypothetical protein